MAESKAKVNTSNQIKPGKNKYRWFCLCSQVEVEQCTQSQLKMAECDKQRRHSRSLTTGSIIFSSETSSTKFSEPTPRQQKLEDVPQNKFRTINRMKGSVKAVSDNSCQISKVTHQIAENGIIPSSRESKTLSINNTECLNFSNSIGFGSTFEYDPLTDIVE